LKRLLTQNILTLSISLSLSLILSACTQDSSTGTGITDATNQPLPTDQSKNYTDGYTSSTEKAVSSISLDDVISAVSLPKSGASLTIRDLTRKCRTVEGGSSEDSDDDGVPQEIKYRYKPENCTGPISGGTRTVDGKLEIQNEDRGGYRETLDVTITDRFTDGRIIIERRRGSAKLNQEARQFVKNFNLTVTRRVNNRPEFRLENTIIYRFNPSGPVDTKINQVLPAGTISVAGTSKWLEGQNLARNFLVSSPNVLTYDPDCAKQGQGITGGTETLNQSGKIVKFIYGPCGTPPTVQSAQ
jgi:hypothetical protein